MKVTRQKAALLLTVAALILCLTAWVGGGWGATVRVEVSPARRELVEAVGAVRPSEGRLTGGFAYARYSPGGASALKNSREIRDARTRIEMSLRKGASSQDFADAGVLHLLGGRHDKAVALLEKATERNPADAGIWSDLAAAYLARAEKDERFIDLLDALEAADQGVRVDPNHPEARFNFALALDHLWLKSRARAGWSQYRDLDGRSEWSQEAESRFAALLQPSFSVSWQESRAAFEQARPSEIGDSARKLVQRFPQQARELVEEALLGSWAAERFQGRLGDAEHTLALAEGLGQALAVRGERMSLESLRAIRVALADAGGSTALGRLIEGHLQYQRGLDQARSFSLATAVPHFEAAKRELSEADSPIGLWAWFRLAVCDTQLFEYKIARRRLEDLLSSRDIRHFPALRARVLWVSGLVYGYQGAPAEALAAYLEALEIFDRLGEKENRAAVANLLAEVHRHLGDLPGAWKFHQAALGGLQSTSNVNKRIAILAELGMSLLADDRAQLSIYVQEELLRGNADPLMPERLVGGLRRMAEAQFRKGSLEKAIALIRHAKREVDRVAEARLREGLIGDLLTLEGRIEATVDAQRAVSLLSAAIQSDERTQNRLRLVRTLLERARALRQGSELELAEQSLERAIQLIRDYRPSEDLFSASFEEVRQIFGEMVRLQVLQGRPRRALEFAERGRAQILSLMAPVGIPAIPVLSLQQIQKAMPADVALLIWWFDGKEVFSWTVRRDGFSFATVVVDSTRLSRTVQRFRELVSSNDVSAAGSVAARLYAALVAPNEVGIGSAGRLVLVVDQVLLAIPFAALRRSANAPYLIEERILSVVPSASLYVHCLRRERDLSEMKLSAIAFGNPAFDREMFRDLRPLPHSEKEAVGVLDTYGRGQVVLGPDVTRTRMLSEIAKWPVVHIGAHAVENPANPFTSAFAVAPARNDTGVLYLRELVKISLPRTRLVFLSACSSLRGSSGTGAGIAVSLLVQGSPAVVGTLWPVGDAETRAFAVDFHRRFIESRDAAYALAQAQVALREQIPLSVWAGFELIGAS